MLTSDEASKCNSSQGEDPQLPILVEEATPSPSEAPADVSTCPEADTSEEVGHYWVIIDDMSFGQLHREARLSICDVYDDTDIHIRYSVAHLPAGTPRILTTNDTARDVMGMKEKLDPAIVRRLQVVEVHCDTSVTPRRMIYFPLTQL